MAIIRPATPSDASALGPLGAALMRQHHATDPRRFILTDRPEAGYGRFLASQLGDPRSAVLVAERSGEVVGYVFAQIMPISWQDLRNACGYVHDVYVREDARREGTGEELMRAAIAWMHSKDMTQVVLMSMTSNASAQRLFVRLGFRNTMVEMTLDPDAAG